MKNYKITALAASILALGACSSNNAVVNGTLENGEGKEIVVKALDVNTYSVLDTVKVGQDGKFDVQISVEKGQPEFVYLYYGEQKLASLLLDEGDKVTVVTDTLGNWSVEGSEESEKLMDVEYSYMKFVNDLYAAQTDKALFETYLEYYRDRIKYVLSNTRSLTVVPVLYQDFEGLPIFSQQTDAMLFRTAVDSLSMVYPDSKYVKALAAEAQARLNVLEINNRIQNTEARSYPELAMNDINGKKISIDELDAKVVLLYFWSSAVPEQSMFNVETLLPLYNDYHDKGFEIYAVSIDIDKVQWAATVRGQKLPWVNVNDGLGNASPSLGLFGVANLPTYYLIENGEILTTPLVGEKALRAELTRVLR